MNVYAGNMISQIKQIGDRIFEQILSKQNIDAFNGAQGRILYVLWQRDNISFKELADRSGLATTTLTGMIDRMETAGLVVRISDPEDRRKIRLVLTDMAKSLQQEYEFVSEQMAAVFYAGFSREEIELCEAMLGRILKNLKCNV